MPPPTTTTSIASIAGLTDELGDECGPAGLMAGAEPLAGVAVEELLERRVRPASAGSKSKRSTPPFDGRRPLPSSGTKSPSADARAGPAPPTRCI